MQVTIDIDDGGKARKALPIRAIPYVCAWSYDAAPDDIVQTLAAPKIKKYYGLAIRLRHNELFAYQLDAQGKYEQIPPSQWEPIADTLKSLATKLQADEREDAEDENRATWKIKAVLELPDNVFIWLDEFQHWYSSTRPIDPESADVEHVAPEDEDEDAGRLTKLDDTLCLSPLIPSEIENQLWRYPKDFEKLTAPKAEAEQPAPAAKVEAVTVTTPPNELANSGLTKREHQIQAIENFADELGYQRQAIPVGGKQKLMQKCKQEKSMLFGAGDDPFLGAWKDASKTGRIHIVNHKKYLRR